jgi:acyl-CoA synthetase (NDP forming)
MAAERTAAEILLTCQSVAIIGASDDGDKSSGRTQRYLRMYNFEGRVYPINPKRETVQGLTSYAKVGDLPEVPDLAVIVMPQSGVEPTVRECSDFGIPLAIIFAAGYAETGAAGTEFQQSLTETVRAGRTRVIGPNCNGSVFAPSRLTAGFMTGLDQDRWELRDDGIAFVSQSGAMGAFILNMAQTDGLGMGRFISTGNEIDLTMPELMRQLVEEGTTRCLLGYVEGVRDGRALEDALRAADQADIPVCLMKVGRSERGAAAAASHTGSLAGADTVYDGVFARYGVQRAISVEHLLDMGRVFASTRRPAGPKVSIVTLSGGAGVLMTDYAEDLGLEVAPWDETWQAKMRAVLPTYATSYNPIDTTGAIASDQDVLVNSLTISLDNPQTDVLMILLGNMETDEERICDTIIRIADSQYKPVLVTWVGGSGRPLRYLNAAGVPTFTDPVRAMRAAAALVDWSLRSKSTGELMKDGPDETIASVVAAATGEYVDEVETKQLLAGAGIRTVAEEGVDTPEQAAGVAIRIGFPVVVKLLSDEVAHKSELGAVQVGLANADAVAAAGADILRRAADAGIAGGRLVVQQQLPTDLEIILGSVVDPTFGPVTMLGLGGVLTEVLADVQVRPSPVDEGEARTMIGALRGAALLRGVRGRRGVDEDALVRTIVAFSRLTARAGDRVRSIEINPLLVDADGQPVAVDALMELNPLTGTDTEETADA